MSLEKEKMTAPCMSVAADKEQSIAKITNVSLSEKAAKCNEEIGMDELQEYVRRMSDPNYLHTVSLTELYDTSFRPKTQIIEGFLCSGVYLFAGAPKVGKSFFVAQLGYHVSAGLPLWDYPISQGAVLYLALEDDYARLQKRLSRMFGMDGDNNFFFATQAKNLKEGLDGQLTAFVREHPDTKLIIIDTLQRIREVGEDSLLSVLRAKDVEMVPGVRTEKQGTYNGKLTRFIQRLETKQRDRRLNFMFNSEGQLLSYDYLVELCKSLMGPSIDGKSGVKIIDFSEVPSDILPLIVSLIARVIFSVQQWTPIDARHPIAIFCDEAHLYIPANTEKSIDAASLITFERISKEGRKYGIGLVVISQRPSEVNRTVLSQSNNFIAMRLTNIDDQSVVKRLLPDSLGDYAEMLPILDIGEALVVGDASLLPSRIRVTAPNLKPRSATIDFWDAWSKETVVVDLHNAIEALRKQSR